MKAFITRVLLCTSALIAPINIASAQMAPGQVAPPAWYSVDRNGVDLATGSFMARLPGISIGPTGAGVSFSQTISTSLGMMHSFDAYLAFGPNTANVIVGEISDQFTLSGGYYVSSQKRGAQLQAINSSTYKYTTSSGTSIIFQSFNPGYTSNNLFLATSITTPDGLATSLNWTEWNMPTQSNCYSPGSCPFTAIGRLSSMTTNTGYGISFGYLTDNAPYFDATNWETLTSAKVSNTATGGTSRTISYSTDALHVLTVTDAAGYATLYVPEAHGWVASIRMPASTVDNIDVTYDGNGRVYQVIRPQGTYTYTWTVDASRRVTAVSVTDPNANVSARALTLDPVLALPLTDTVAGRTTTYTYDSFGHVKRVTAPQGNYTQYTYDARGNVVQTDTVANANGGVRITTQATYNASCTGTNVCANKPDTIIDARSFITSYSYDPTYGVLTAITPPSALAPVSLSYQDVQAVGGGTIHLLLSKSQGGTTATYAYPTSGNPLPSSITVAGGGLSATQTLTYTPDGDVRSVSGPVSGMVMTHFYDALRREVGMVGPGANASGTYPAINRIYDSNGRLTSLQQGTSDSAGSTFTAQATTGYNYDAAGRVTSMTVAGSVTASSTSYTYDAADRPLTTTLAMGSAGPDRTTTNAYDSNGLLQTVTTASGTADASTVTYSYTTNGKTASIKDGNSNLVQYAYDGFDRLRTTTYADNSTEVLSYDTNSNLTSDKRRDGRTIGYGYDAVGNRTSRTGPLSNTYTYDTLGRLTAATGGSFNVGRTYDALGNMLTDSIGGNTVTNRYDAAGRRIYISPSGAGGHAIFQYDYLANGALGHIADSDNVPHATFSYDDLGRLTNIARTSAHNTALTYGPDLRLASLTHSFGAGAGNAMGNDVSFGFTYNPAGQIVSRTVSNDAYVYTPPTVDQAYTPNGLNQLTLGSAVSYDGQGNALGSTLSPTSTRAFDALGKLTSGYQGGGATTTLLYDALDRLASVQAGPATPVRIAWDGDERVGSWVGAAGNNPVMMINDGTGAPVVGADFSAGAFVSTTDFFTDERGSLIAEGTRYPATAITQHYTYGPYGRESSSSHASLLGYAGGVALPGAGLVHMRARAYDPALGRFASPDPIGVAGGVNLYGYAGGDPVNRTDPSGNKPGDRFATPELARQDANATYYQIAVDRGMEYAGFGTHGRAWAGFGDVYYSYTLKVIGYYHTNEVDLGAPYLGVDFISSKYIKADWWWHAHDNGSNTPSPADYNYSTRYGIEGYLFGSNGITSIPPSPSAIAAANQAVVSVANYLASQFAVTVQSISTSSASTTISYTETGSRIVRNATVYHDANTLGVPLICSKEHPCLDAD